MRNNRRWAMGRRRYSWERGQSRPRNQPEPDPIAGGVAGVLMILLLAYVIFQPLFWVLIVVFGIIAALFAFAGALLLWEKISKPRPAPWIEQKNAPCEKAIGHRVDPCVAESASDKPVEAHMTHDTRLALIDREGDVRFPAIINGTFQIGKGRDELPTRIEDFARAILIDAKDGRFVCADGRKPGILKFSGRAKEAQSYRLDPTVAAKLGIPAQGTR